MPDVDGDSPSTASAVEGELGTTSGTWMSVDGLPANIDSTALSVLLGLCGNVTETSVREATSKDGQSSAEVWFENKEDAGRFKRWLDNLADAFGHAKISANGQEGITVQQDISTEPELVLTDSGQSSVSDDVATRPALTDPVGPSSSSSEPNFAADVREIQAQAKRGSKPEPGLLDGTSKVKPITAEEILEQGLTSLMLRNLPHRLSQDSLLAALNSNGFEGLYDFCYVPCSFRSAASHGYGFVNFTSAEAAADLASLWQDQVPFAHSEGKRVLIAKAALQGRQAFVDVYSRRKLDRVRNPRFRPYIRSADEASSNDSTVRSSPDDGGSVAPATERSSAERAGSSSSGSSSDSSAKRNSHGEQRPGMLLQQIIDNYPHERLTL